jgi:hypothetical protein
MNDVLVSIVHWNELPFYHVCWWEMIFQKENGLSTIIAQTFWLTEMVFKLLFQEYKSTPYQIEKWHRKCMNKMVQS